MLFRTHLAFALLLFCLIIGTFKGMLLFLIFVLIGAAFVDIDSSSSKIGKAWFLRPLQYIVRHRGMFHSLLFSIFISVLVWFVNKNAGYGFALGYGSHLFLDCLTPIGLKVLWPFSDAVFRFPIVRTGSLIENMIFVLMLLGDVFLVYRIIF